MSWYCAKCGKQVYQMEKIDALDRHWHKACFTCTSCGDRLNRAKYAEHNNQPYCHPCYNRLFRQSGYGTGANLSSYRNQPEVVEKIQHEQVKAGNKKKTWGSGGTFLRPSDSYSSPKDTSFRSSPKNTSFRSSPKNTFNSSPKNTFNSSPKNVRSSPTNNISPSFKCSVCFREITGKIIEVDDNYYHEHCFCCFRCDRQLSTTDFFFEDGHYYCGRCHEELQQPKYEEPRQNITRINSKPTRTSPTRTRSPDTHIVYDIKDLPTCTKCFKKIEGEVARVDGNDYHPSCFTCYRCDIGLAHRPFFKEDGQYYCQKCLDLINDSKTRVVSDFRPKSLTCETCGLPISSGVIEALGKSYHPNCFLCSKCGLKLRASKFYEYYGKPICELCHDREIGPSVKNTKTTTTITSSLICHTCNLPITSGAIEALGRHYHPNCFICSRCGKKLPTSKFFEQYGSPICERCHDDIVNPGLQNKTTFKVQKTTPKVKRVAPKPKQRKEKKTFLFKY
ncbi:lim domain family [Anaeramoeba ignava]|uniref:Lim domain family n=1 Tax=Anaeramoeba ignava TaxID=1746090 RepID=A0A9Q0LGA9_ANAIG|nr:lim domain family [Anaeramoeba ignava]